MKEFIFEVNFGFYSEQYRVYAPDWTKAREILGNNILHAFSKGVVMSVTYIDTRPVV